MLILPLALTAGALTAGAVLHGRQPPVPRRPTADTLRSVVPAVPAVSRASADSARATAICRDLAAAPGRGGAPDRMPRVVPGTTAFRMPRGRPDVSGYRMPIARPPADSLVARLPDGRVVPCPPG